MSADWKPGDRAIRVESNSDATDHLYDYPYGKTIKGAIYLVTDISVESFEDDPKCVCLSFAGNPGAIHKLDGALVGWPAEYFRKIVPKCDQVAIEEYNHDLR